MSSRAGRTKATALERAWQPLSLVQYTVEPGQRPTAKYASRREMAFVGGARLQQVLVKSLNVADGRFWVDRRRQEDLRRLFRRFEHRFVEIRGAGQGIWAASREPRRVERPAGSSMSPTTIWAAMHLGPHQTVLNCRVREQQPGWALEPLLGSRNSEYRLQSQRADWAFRLNGHNSLLDSERDESQFVAYSQMGKRRHQVIVDRPSGNTIVGTHAQFNNWAAASVSTRQVGQRRRRPRIWTETWSPESSSRRRSARTGRSTTSLSNPLREDDNDYPQADGVGIASCVTRGTSHLQQHNSRCSWRRNSHFGWRQATTARISLPTPT